MRRSIFVPLAIAVLVILLAIVFMGRPGTTTAPAPNLSPSNPATPATETGQPAAGDTTPSE